MRKIIAVVLMAFAVVAFALPAHAVYVDPNQIDIAVSEDAPTYNQLPNSTNDNYVDTNPDELWTGNFWGNSNTRSYFKFNLPVLPPINSAYLWVYNSVNSGPGSTWGDAAVTAYTGSDAWTAGTITWNTQPGPTGTGGTTIVGNNLGWYTWDVTSLAQAAGAGAFSLALATAPNAPGHVYYGDGNNNGLTPFLRVTTAPEPVSSALFLMGGAALAAKRLRRKTKKA